MVQKKLDEYKLTGRIHTIAVMSPGVVQNISEEVKNCIKASARETKNGLMTTSIINVHKLMGDVFSFEEFQTALETIQAGAGIPDYKTVRADMCFDSYENDHYDRYAKLNRYLVSLMAMQYKMKNRYITRDLFSEKQLSAAVKDSHIELECYDKARESDGRDPAKSRLEERSKDMPDNDLRREFMEVWFDRWDKALSNDNITAVQQKYNDELERIYKEGRNAYPVRFKSVTDFLIQYQNLIFCKKQMVDLLSRLDEVSAPVYRAENHKRRYGIEYFSKADLKRAVAEIKRSTTEYFEN